MKDNQLIAKISALLEDKDPLIQELIFQTIEEVESKRLSTETHAKQIERMLDIRLQQTGEEVQ